MTMKQMMPDISSILYLALARKEYCNSYRFTMSMNEEVDPQLLKQAVHQVKERFSMFFCGFQPSLFHDVQKVYEKHIPVEKDTQIFKIFSRKEIESCAARILYRENKISIEFFHALTDGYGAVAFISTLTAQYLRLRYHIDVPTGYPVMDLNEVCEEEVQDAYLKNMHGTNAKLRRIAAYQLPREKRADSTIRVSEKTFSYAELKSASSFHQVSPTAFLSTLMAETMMKIQKKYETKLKPVRIMIPVNLRGFFPSRTFRNFIETVHVTLNPEDLNRSLKERALQFKEEMKQQLSENHLASLIKTHVDAQSTYVFRMIPRSLKYFGFKIGYALFGESNSSMTLTNLGVVHLPESMHPYVQKIDCYLSPRTASPYNCAMITYRDQVSLNFSSFNQNSDLEEKIFHQVEKILKSAEFSLE